MEPLLRSFSATIDDVNPSDRSIVAKVGVGSVDRYNTVISPAGIDLRNFIANPVVLFSHGKDPLRGELPVGRCLWIRVEKSGPGRLIAKTRFGKDPFSQTLYEMYESGDMRGWSVSILPNDFGKPTQAEVRARPEIADIDCIFRTSELIEYSCTSTPGHAEALTLDEMRSLSRVITRGIPVPIDIKALVEKAMTESQGMTNGGALVKPDDCTDSKSKGPDTPAPPSTDEIGVKAKKKRAADDSDDDDDDADDAGAVKEGITITTGGMAVVGMNADDAETVTPEPVIELPPLTGRSIQQVFHECRLMILDHERRITRKIDDHVDWLHGKA